MVVKVIKLLDSNYEIENGKENFNEEETKYLFTEYFLDFDYVLGDYSYGKLRLKGFRDSDNAKVKDINNIKNIDNYIKEYCYLGSKTFLLKKIK